MDDSVPSIQPRVAIAPTGSRRDPRRRRRREYDGAEARGELPSDPSPESEDARDSHSVDTSVGRATHGEPGTNLDLTA